MERWDAGYYNGGTEVEIGWVEGNEATIAGEEKSRLWRRRGCSLNKDQEHEGDSHKVQMVGSTIRGGGSMD